MKPVLDLSIVHLTYRKNTITLRCWELIYCFWVSIHTVLVRFTCLSVLVLKNFRSHPKTEANYCARCSCQLNFFNISKLSSRFRIFLNAVYFSFKVLSWGPSWRDCENIQIRCPDTGCCTKTWRRSVSILHLWICLFCKTRQYFWR